MTSPPADEGRLRSDIVRRKADGIQLRRGITGVLLTLVLPGAAQIANGNKAVGRFAMRVWIALWLVVLAMGVLALTKRSLVVTMATTGWVLSAVAIVLLIVGVGWGLLFIDAWRLGRPAELAVRHRPGFALFSGVLALTVIFGSIGAARTVWAHQQLVDHLFSGGGNTTVDAGRYNILLLGADAGASRVGLRPDSITVASISASTGRTVLFSLPRNLEDVPFAESSPMHKEFPNGFTCENHECMLNGIYTYASEHKDLYPGVADPGAQATKEAVENLTGLTINYYAMIDLKGFEALIDAVGGINMDIAKRVPIGGGTSPILGWIEPGKNVHLNGNQALWFARSREGSSDFERMARQKCVMVAMLNQLDPVTVLTKFQGIAKAGEEIAVTDVPQSETGTLVELAMKARTHKISNVNFVPPLIHPGSPDFAKIRSVVAEKVAASQAADLPASTAPAPPASNATTGAPGGAASTPAGTAASTPASTASASATPDPETDDLGSVCSAR